MRLTMRSRLSVSFGTLGKGDIVFVDSSSAIWARSSVAGRWQTLDICFDFRATNDYRPTTVSLPYCRRLRDGPFLNSLLEQLSHKDSLHEHARRMHHVGIQFSRLDQVFDLGDGDLGRGGHHRIEIARRLAIDEITPAVALPRLDECEVGPQRAFHDVGAAVELSRFLALGDHRTNAGRSKE